MTLIEAKELVISGMNYAAYKETGTSLYDEDKNRLFGSEHYISGRPIYSPSPWGTGEKFEIRMIELLRWALQLGSALGNYNEALRVLGQSDELLGRICRVVSKDRRTA